MSNGQEEISLSVEETNALRAKLGLKPLCFGTADTARDSTFSVTVGTSNVHETPDSVDKEEGKRLVAQISSGGGVLDVLEASDSLAVWLQKQVKKPKVSSSPENELNSDSESSIGSEDSPSDISGDSLSSSNSD
jgi:U4/U6.U5 tri-snRNP-associated protein 1